MVGARLLCSLKNFPGTLTLAGAKLSEQEMSQTLLGSVSPSQQWLWERTAFRMFVGHICPQGTVPEDGSAIFHLNAMKSSRINAVNSKPISCHMIGAEH